MCDNIIGLCASHIKSPEHLKLFELMLLSWKSNTKSIPLFVSMSANIPDNVKNKISVWNELFPLLTVYFSDNQLSQFKHYKVLVENINCSLDTYVILTDDDDLWNIDRVATISDIINSCNNDIIILTSYITTKTNRGEPNLYPEINSISTFAVACENLGTSTELKDDPREWYYEYWNISSKYKIFKDFILRSSEEILSDKYADLCFVKYINSYPTKDKVIVSKRPVYFYRETGRHPNLPFPKCKTIHEFTRANDNNLRIYACRSISYENFIHNVLDCEYIDTTQLKNGLNSKSNRKILETKYSVFYTSPTYVE